MVTALDLSKISAMKPDTEGVWSVQADDIVSYPEATREAYARIEERSFWFDHRNHVLKSIIQRFPPPGAILDVGGGNGFVALALQDAGFPVTLLEPSRYACSIAHARGVRAVGCSTFAGASFQSRVLPAIGLFDVLEHVEDDRAMLREFERTLAPGGRLYVTVPAFNTLWSDADRYAGHFRRYRRSQLVSLLRETGFDVEFASYFFSVLVPGILVLRVGRQLLGGKLDHDAEDEHRLPRNMIGKIATGLLRAERRRLAAGRSLPFGSSCAVVARARSDRGA